MLGERLTAAVALAVTVCSAGVVLAQAAPARRLVADKPPLKSRIVEGLSMGGVEIGMRESEVYGLWGKPRSSACHGSSGAEPPGSPTYRWGGEECYWAIQRAAMGVAEGLISVLFGPGAGNGDELVVLELSIDTGGARVPKYRRWKTSRGIGLTSSLTALKRAYGPRLRKVPPQAGTVETERIYYVTTRRDVTRWVTSYTLPTGTSHGAEKPPPAYVVDRVAGIEIMSAPAFRNYFAPYAPRGWSP